MINTMPATVQELLHAASYSITLNIMGSWGTAHKTLKIKLNFKPRLFAQATNKMCTLEYKPNITPVSVYTSPQIRQKSKVEHCQVKSFFH